MNTSAIKASVGLGLVAIIATACGGGGDGTAKSPGKLAPPASTTTITSGAGETLALPAADPASAAIGRRGLLQVADFGGDWTVYKAQEDAPVESTGIGSRIGCAFTAGAKADDARAVVDGVIAQKGSTTNWVTSSVLAFADETVASAAVEAFRSDAWRACRVEAKTRGAKATAGDATNPQWRADPVDDLGARGQGGFEGFVAFTFQDEVEGEMLDANGIENVTFYQIDNMVLVVAMEGVGSKSDAPDLYEQISAEEQRAKEAALGRLA